MLAHDSRVFALFTWAHGLGLGVRLGLWLGVGVGLPV